MIELNLNEEEILNEIKDIDEFEIKYFLFEILINIYCFYHWFIVKRKPFIIKKYNKYYQLHNNKLKNQIEESYRINDHIKRRIRGNKYDLFYFII